MDLCSGVRTEGRLDPRKLEAFFLAARNMQSYEQMAEAHVRHLQKLVPAFDNLYNAMPEQQKKLADQVFRANAERHAAQSRHGANATAK